jgi:restriction endonuclease Mrr
MFNVANDLRERFDYAAYFYLSAWERDPNMRIEGNTIIREEDDFEEIMIDTFEALRDSVEAVPAALLSNTLELRSQIGPERFEQIVVERIQAIGAGSLPRDATEFVEALNRILQDAS